MFTIFLSIIEYLTSYNPYPKPYHYTGIHDCSIIFKNTPQLDFRNQFVSKMDTKKLDDYINTYILSPSSDKITTNTKTVIDIHKRYYYTFKFRNDKKPK
jgi:hypothetical protein